MCWFKTKTFALFLLFSSANSRPEEGFEVFEVFENPKDCLVEERSSDESKPCQFPFLYKNETFHGCTLKDATGNSDSFTGSPWCSTKINQLTFAHISGGGFFGDCLDENCPSAEFGRKTIEEILAVQNTISKFFRISLILDTVDCECVLICDFGVSQFFRVLDQIGLKAIIFYLNLIYHPPKIVSSTH